MDQKTIRRLNYGRDNVQKVKRNLEGRWYTEISEDELLLRAMLELLKSCVTRLSTECNGAQNLEVHVSGHDVG